MKHTLNHLIEYPKLLCFLIVCVLAYVLFQQGAFAPLIAGLNGHGYVSFFIGGILFSFGFTAPFAVAMFIEAASQADPYIAAPVAGIGALLSDLCIFGLARLSFSDELHRLRSTALIQRLHSLLHHESVSEHVRRYLLWSVAGLVIASPLPDEFGVTLLGGVTDINSRTFGMLCYALNTTGILLILLGTRALA